MKLWLIGGWVTAVALGSAYAMALNTPPPQEASKNAPLVVLQTQKTRVVNIPIVADSQVAGFVSIQFAFTVDATLLKTLQVPPDVYLLDEAFRAIYTDQSFDTHHVDKYDLPKLTNILVKKTNDRLGVPLVKDVMIENFAYIDKNLDRP